MTPTFKTRSELYASLNYDLEQNLNRYVSEGRSVYDQGWLKTQILEYGNKSISDSHNQILKDLLELISNSPEMELSETEEENLFAINVSDKEDGGEIYIDSSDHRFFTLFSKIKSNFFDRAVNRLTYNTLLDRAWFAMEILNSYRELGYFRGSGGKYDNRFFFGDELENAEFNESSQYSFKSWGKSDKLLKLIREDEELRHEFALTSVRIRKNLRDEELEHYIIDDISFQGKITSLGTSFSAHKSLLDPVKDLYRNIVVEKIENRLSLRHSSILEGEPIVILFPREMRVSLDFFAKNYLVEKSHSCYLVLLKVILMILCE